MVCVTIGVPVPVFNGGQIHIGGWIKSPPGGLLIRSFASRWWLGSITGFLWQPALPFFTTSLNHMGHMTQAWTPNPFQIVYHKAGIPPATRDTCRCPPAVQDGSGRLDFEELIKVGRWKK